MLDVKIQFGAIYHIQSKKRHDVEFSDSLRTLTIQTIEEIRKILRDKILPPPVSNRSLCKIAACLIHVCPAHIQI
ncbi:PF01930 domain protein [Leptospira interrogans str. UT126]|nr:PF01930 domain protein [Leptospira interrogans str. UT126]